MADNEQYTSLNKKTNTSGLTLWTTPTPTEHVYNDLQFSRTNRDVGYINTAYEESISVYNEISHQKAKNRHRAARCTPRVVGIAIFISLIVIGSAITLTYFFAIKDTKVINEEISPPQGTTTAVQTTLATPLATTTIPSTKGWSVWGEWTQCTTTCGSGIHKRYRTCSDGATCIGDYVSQAICTTGPCPVYGIWTTWYAWGSCGVTCGGGVQTRTRTCTKAVPTDIECVGKETQQQQCAGWDCPDCTQVCSVGTLNSECDTCICDTSVIAGRVVAAETGNPVSNAVLYSASAPTRMLAQTNSIGFFSLNATCTATELIVRREGFIDTVLTLESSDLVVTMAQLVLPYFTETPQSKYRLSGENVTFCCVATGSPSITYYEWFKNSRLLDAALFPNGTYLQLIGLELTDSGQYTCRANSPVGAVTSTVATLNVKGNADNFCADALQQKTIALPDDCIQPTTNTATFEVGECIAKGCRLHGPSNTEACREDSSSCCATLDADLETVHCSGYEMSIVVVKSCGCASCNSNLLTISGTALGFSTNLPLRFGEVLVNGKFERYTSNTGKFSFIVSKLTETVVINVKDTSMNKLLDTVKIIEISDDMSGTINLNIRMFELTEPVAIQSNVENVLTAGVISGSETPIVQISVPAGAFFSPDGTPYTGTVAASLTFIDPAQTKDVPGVFQFVDDEGQNVNLASLGVFNLFFQDESGNDLVLDEVIDVYLPLTIGKNAATDEFKLWRLSPETGIWEIMKTGIGNRRKRKRSNTGNLIGEIDWSTIISHRTWINIDQVYRLTSDPCYFKFRVFKDSELNEPVQNPSRMLQVQSHMILNNIFNTFSYNTHNPSETCFPVVCENNIGHIAVSYWGRRAYESLYATKPVVTENTVFNLTDEDKILKIGFTQTSAGPFYYEEAVCKASTTSDNHLRFYYESDDYSYIFNEIYNPPVIGRLTDYQIKLSAMTWYPDRNDGYSACFVKIKISFKPNIRVLDKQTIKIRVISTGGRNIRIVDEILGLKERKISEITNTTVCMEYKCSGIILPKTYEESDYTKVNVTPIVPKSSIKCRVISESEYLTTGINETHIGQSNFVFYAPTDGGYTHGVYVGTSDQRLTERAKEYALEKCDKAGSNTVSDPNAGLASTIYCENV